MNTVQPTDTSPKSFRRYYRPITPILEKPQNRVYTTTILSFLTVSLFIWYAIRPTIQTILSLRREIKDSVIVSEQMETKIEALVEAQAAYQSIIPQLPLLDEAIPTTPDMVHLIRQIHTLASTVNATVSATTLSKVPLISKQNKDKSLEKVATPLTITINGSYESIRSFITALYQLRRIITISHITIVPTANNNRSVSNENLILTFTLDAYSAFK